MLKNINNKAGTFLNVLLVILFTVLVMDVLWGVFTRYMLGSQARWSEELARLVMVWLGLLGAALAFREEKHLGLDIVVRQWVPEVQNVARLFVHATVGLFGLLIMTIGGGQLVLQRLAAGQLLPALGISKAWFYLSIPVSGILIVLFSLELMSRVIADMKKERKSS
ncbi:MAG: TRAP transporter small permease [Puniceicoccaceae bacterium]